MNDDRDDSTNAAPTPAMDAILAEAHRLIFEEGDRQRAESLAGVHPGLGAAIQEMIATAKALEDGMKFIPPTGASTLLPVDDPEDLHSHPARFGDFRVIKILHAGGMGVVYLAEQESLGRLAAVKVVRPSKASARAMDRFRREIRVLSRLHQSNIVPIFAAGKEGELLFFAMPYIDGPSLQEFLDGARLAIAEYGSIPSYSAVFCKASEISTARKGKEPGAPNAEVSRRTTIEFASPIDETPTPAAPETGNGKNLVRAAKDYSCKIANALCDAATALHKAHSQGILHRDVKPSNLMFDREGKLWVIDFGLAGVSKQQPVEVPTSNDKGLTRTGDWYGTLPYMAPEQFGGKVGPSTDIWAFGVVLYELLTMRRAFTGPNARAIADKIANHEFDHPSKHAPHLDPDLTAVCLKAMAKTPEERYVSAAAFADDLRRWTTGRPVAANPPQWLNPASWARTSWKWCKRERAKAAAIGTTLASSVIVVLALLAHSRATAAEARRDAAEARVGEASARLQMAQASAERVEIERAKHMIELKALRRDAKPGWFDRGWKTMEKLADSRRDDALRDAATAHLVGLDATVVAEMRTSDRAEMAFDDSGKRIAIGGANDRDGKPLNKAGLWKWETNEFRDAGVAGAGPVGFFPNGTAYQFVAVDGGHFGLWNLDSNKFIQSFEVLGDGPSQPISALEPPVTVIAKDGLHFAAATKVDGNKSIVVVWDAMGREVLRIPGPATSLTFSPDGSLLAIGNQQGRISIWSFATKTRLAEIATDHSRITSLALARDRRIDTAGQSNAPTQTSGWMLASGDFNGQIVVWNLATLRPVSFCHGAILETSHLRFSGDGTRLLATGRDVFRIWNTRTGELEFVNGVDRFVLGFAASMDDSLIAAIGVPFDRRLVKDCKLLVWKVADHRGARPLRGLTSYVNLGASTPDFRLVAVLAQNWQVGVWDSSTGRLLSLIDVPKGEFSDSTAIAFTSDGRKLAYVGAGTAILWKVDPAEVPFLTEIGRWRLPPGLGDILIWSASGSLRLVRMETEGMIFPPFREVDPRRHPRVIRERELLMNGGLRLVKEIADLPRGIGSITSFDAGSKFAVLGRTKDGTERMYCYEYPSWRTLWDRPMAPNETLAGASSRGIELQAEHFRYLLDSATGRERERRPDVDYFLDFQPASRFLASLLDGGIVITRFPPSDRWQVIGDRMGVVLLVDHDEIRRRLALLGMAPPPLPSTK